MACDLRLNRSLVRLPPTLPADFPPFNPSHPFYAIDTTSTPEIVQRSSRSNGSNGTGAARGRPLLRSLTATAARRKRQRQAAAPAAQEEEERSRVLHILIPTEQQRLDHVSCVPPKPPSRSRSWSVRKTLEAMVRAKTSDGPLMSPLSPGELPRPLGKLVDNIGRSLSRRRRNVSRSTQPMPMPMSSISPQSPQVNSVETSRSRRYGKIYATSPL